MQELIQCHRRAGPVARSAEPDRAVLLRPDSPWAHCERGDALHAAGRDEEALAHYDLALALDLGYASAYASRGVPLSGLGRHDQALRDLDRALELSPAYAWARARRDEVRRRRDDAGHDCHPRGRGRSRAAWGRLVKVRTQVISIGQVRSFRSQLPYRSAH
ncbi:tetratricopeptide repeat protein [Streptomyces pratens]|uniref:Tetratricopeptide repeat protein n=1 Tax=Streptomyces pratens TaxID=887456 RepID=A0ABW1MAH7_9ACTN